jgi:PIN domain nuclease of toxin-antitoxin system
VNRAVTDAHPLIWYAFGQPKRLGRVARRLFDRAEAGRATIYVPTIVLVEVSEAARRGKFRLVGGLSVWAEKLFRTLRYFPADLTVAVTSRAETLYSIRERSDRLIAATAAELNLPLITRDATIAEAVETIW